MPASNPFLRAKAVPSRSSTPMAEKPSPTIPVPSPTLPSLPLLSPGDVANLLGVTVKTLERWRSTGHGPSYVKLSGASVRYPSDAVGHFVQANLHMNTAV